MTEQKCLGFAELLKQAETVESIVAEFGDLEAKVELRMKNRKVLEAMGKRKVVSVDVLKPLIPKIEEALAFIDHIQDHINHGDKGVHKDAHVICKFCGRTPKEIVDLNRECQP